MKPLTCPEDDQLSNAQHNHCLETVPLDLVPPDHTMPRQESESSNKYIEEPNTCCHLAELLDQFWLLQDQVTHLELATHLSMHMDELMQLTDRLDNRNASLDIHMELLV